MIATTVREDGTTTTRLDVSYVATDLRADAALQRRIRDLISEHARPLPGAYITRITTPDDPLSAATREQ